MKAKWLLAGLLSVALCLLHSALDVPNNAPAPAHHNSNSRQAGNTTQGSPATSTNVVTPNSGQGYAEVANQAPVPNTSREGELSGVEPEKPQAQAKVAVQEVPETPKQLAQRKAAQYGWVGAEWDALVDLWHKESGWNPRAVNQSSGACGLPQALPCSKIPNPDSVESQIDWGLRYIADRYDTPSKALAFWHYGAPKYNGSNWY